MDALLKGRHGVALGPEGSFQGQEGGGQTRGVRGGEGKGGQVDWMGLSAHTPVLGNDAREVVALDLELFDGRSYGLVGL